jgi:hypothetical protein
VPARLLARLAVDMGIREGGSVGREQASRWYQRFGFEASPTDPLHLVLLMKDLRAFLTAAE